MRLSGGNTEQKDMHVCVMETSPEGILEEVAR